MRRVYCEIRSINGYCRRWSLKERCSRCGQVVCPRHGRADEVREGGLVTRRDWVCLNCRNEPVTDIHVPR